MCTAINLGVFLQFRLATLKYTYIYRELDPGDLDMK